MAQELKMNLAEVFKDVTVGDIWEGEKTIITFHEKDSVAKCLEILDQKKILSAPVVSETGTITGLVDVLDIALFIIGLFPADVSREGLTEADVRKVLYEGEKFKNSPISDVLELSMAIKHKYEHMFTVKKSTPLVKLMEMFYQGVHRVLLVADDGTTTLDILSQSDLLGILAQCVPFLPQNWRNTTVQQLGLDKKELKTVKATQTVISVLSSMQTAVDQPILSAVPIVDDDGNLIGNFSATNLKSLQTSSFTNLLLPVYDFLRLQPTKRTFTLSLHSLKSLYPVTCTPGSTFEEVVLKLSGHKIHRIWVTENNKPVGVITIGDIFKTFVPWAQNS